MVLLQITTRIYPDIGGVASHVHSLSNYMSEKNIKTIIISCKTNESKTIKKKIVNENLIQYYLNFPAPKYEASFLELIIFFLKFFLLGLKEAIKLYKIYKIEIIHAHSPPPSGLIALFLSKVLKIPYLYTIHGLDYPNSLMLKIDGILMAKNSKKLIAVSRVIKNYLIKNLKLRNIIWIPNGINTSQYYHVQSIEQKQEIISREGLDSYVEQNDFIITYIGYMVLYQKVLGMIDFLRGFSGFLGKIKNHHEKEKIKLLYIGDGKYSFLLKREIIRLGLQKNVIFLGKRKKINHILAISDFFGLTSYHENFPIVLLEAMASKISCLGTDSGEIKNIIGNTGYLVKPGNINKIEESIQNFYVLSEEEKNKMRKDSRDRVEKKFDRNIVYNDLLKIVKEI